MQSEPSTQTKSRKRDGHLSKDRKWRSFPKVPHLLQYVSNGNYYGRIKIHGKLIRESLETDVWTNAKTMLVEFLQKHNQRLDQPAAPIFKEAVELFIADLESDSTMKASSKGYRLDCLVKLERTWPGLWELRLDQITARSCKEWAAKLHQKIAAQYYNNMIGTLRLVIARGIKEHKEKTGETMENPAMEVKRVR